MKNMVQSQHLGKILLKMKNLLNAILELGDVCFYEGTKMNHWREPFEGNECYQLFIHYVRKNGKYSDFEFDKRPNLGFEAGSQKNELSIDNFL